MKDEMRAALRKMKSDKATDPDSMSVGLLVVLGDYGNDKVAITRNIAERNL